MKYLTLETVQTIHDDILRDTQEDKGLAPDTSLIAALHRIDHHILYDGLSDFYEIAALYGIAITKGHCFNNGNKRTALVSMISFLSINNIEVDVDNALIEEVMVDIATDLMNTKQLTLWLKKHSKYTD